MQKKDTEALEQPGKEEKFPSGGGMGEGPGSTPCTVLVPAALCRHPQHSDCSTGITHPSAPELNVPLPTPIPQPSSPFFPAAKVFLCHHRGLEMDGRSQCL